MRVASSKKGVIMPKHGRVPEEEWYVAMRRRNKEEREQRTKERKRDWGPKLAAAARRLKERGLAVTPRSLSFEACGPIGRKQPVVYEFLRTYTKEGFAKIDPTSE